MIHTFVNWSGTCCPQMPHLSHVVFGLTNIPNRLRDSDEDEEDLFDPCELPLGGFINQSNLFHKYTDFTSYIDQSGTLIP